MKLEQTANNILLSIKDHPWRVLLALILAIVFNYVWGHIAAIFLGVFVLFALLKWDSRVFIAIGLLFLISCPFYLLQRKELMAEEMAVYAYYSLFLGVCLQIIEYIRDGNKGQLTKLTNWLTSKRSK